MILPNWSCKHDVLIQSDDGSRQPMDVPYFQAVQIAPETWQIESDGDYSYLLAGEEEAILIDSGYGCGNIREYCQSLTSKPLKNVVNTHEHFDHTANNFYFENAYMSEYCSLHASIPFNSFSGMTFPRDYPRIIVEEGDVIPLKGRELDVLEVRDHAPGSLLFLDRSHRLLFAGDELRPVKPLKVSVEKYMQYMEKLMLCRSDFDTICTGMGLFDANIIDDCLTACKKVLAGETGETLDPSPAPEPVLTDEQGRTVFLRRRARPVDKTPSKSPFPSDSMRKLCVNGTGIVYSTENIFNSPVA